MSYQPQHLKRWTMPRDYFGAKWPECYSAGAGQSRDSDALERANFKAMQRALPYPSELPSGEPSWQVVRESHWAVGWVEWIAIHESDENSLRAADEIAEQLAGYPVIDDELFSEIEDEDCAATWTNCFDPAERIEYFRTHSWSNHPFPGESKLGMLRKAIAGDWGYAANLLHSPSDLLY